VNIKHRCVGFPAVLCDTNQDCVDASAGSTCSSTPLAETLSAPGEPIVLSGEPSTAICLTGSLQYRYSDNTTGTELRGWSEDPVFVDAPTANTNYKVQVRCSSDPTNVACINSAVVVVTVHCPYSSPRLNSTLFQTSFGPVLAASGTSKSTFQWTTATRHDVFTAPMNVTGTHTGAGNAATLTDGSKAYTVNALVGLTIRNITDGSQGTITANTATTVTATLAGGTENDWDVADAYRIIYAGLKFYSGAIVGFGPGGVSNTFVDATVPLAGEGLYYIVRQAGQYCNEAGFWTGGNPTYEAPAGAGDRDSSGLLPP
jgi:hypothetical protein